MQRIYNKARYREKKAIRGYGKFGGQEGAENSRNGKKGINL